MCTGTGLGRTRLLIDDAACLINASECLINNSACPCLLH